MLHPNSGLGNPVIDVRSLNAKTGFFTHDPGFTSTSSCESAISFIDGAKGLLMHRGYPIEQLASSCSFLEVRSPLSPLISPYLISSCSFLEVRSPLSPHISPYLISSCSLLEVAFLLIEGELPTAPHLGQPRGACVRAASLHTPAP